MIRVKICGLTRADEALAAARAGADAIGLVFHPASPRAVSVTVARQLVDALPPFVSSVGLFVDADPAVVEDTLRRCPLDLLQFHGDESPAYCRAFGRPYLKAIRVRADMDVAAEMARYPDARGILLDAFVAAAPGGTGQRFDWTLIPREAQVPIILAGGLSPDNVAEAVRQVRPYAVDVSSGVENAPGRKDPDLVRRFIEHSRRALSAP